MHDTGVPQAPENLGILAIEVHIPPTYVSQEELEVLDGVPSGKYTAGLGQKAMSFCEDCEDVVSMALSAVHALLFKHGIDAHRIGRLEVGTESAPDRSKSVKSCLLPLFRGNSSIEGGDCVHACLGATTAVFNAVNWLESRAWDGRLAIVVATDAAQYPLGPARASGGAGAVAMLIGPDAPLVLDRSVSASHFQDAHDFYKPVDAFYPQWDGAESVATYLRTLRACYASYCTKFEEVAAKAGRAGKAARHTLDRVDFALFHTPFNKMARKAIATLADADARRKVARRNSLDGSQPLNGAAKLPTAVSLDGTESLYHAKVAAGAELPRQTGNLYTGSLWSSLASLVAREGEELESCQVLLYSYGSGAAGCMFSLRGRRCGNARFSLYLLSKKLNLDARLEARVKRSPAEFHAAANAAAARWGAADWTPTSRGEHMRPGSYRLMGVDAKFHRTYEQVRG